MSAEEIDMVKFANGCGGNTGMGAGLGGRVSSPSRVRAHAAVRVALCTQLVCLSFVLSLPVCFLLSFSFQPHHAEQAPV